MENLHRNVKTVAMPLGMVVGALLCRPISALEAWSHQLISRTMIFLMRFFSFCRGNPKQMRPSMLHLWMLLFQIVGSVAVFFALSPLN